LGYTSRERTTTLPAIRFEKERKKVII